MIDIAIDAAKQGGQLAYSYLKKNKKVLYKSDNSPVTIADRNTEKLIRTIISKKFPDHGFIGEEFGETKPDAKYQWVIDPVDGTKDFIRGGDFWSTFIALLENNKPILGVVYSSTTNELFSAERGKGLYLNSRRIKLPQTRDLSLATITYGSLDRFEKKKYLGGLMKIVNKVQNKRSLGSHNLNSLLRGQAEIDLEAGGSIWDFAAPSILVEEGGGTFTDFKGNKSFTSGDCVFSNGPLHQSVIELLNS